MSLRYQTTVLLLALGLSIPVAAKAEIYKCVAENGELTFSQAPCPEEGSKVTVMSSTGGSSRDAADCEHARRFALTTAQQMRSGAQSTAIFDSYGGIDALSRGSVSLISYVFQFRTNDDISAERVSALATAKCQARAFGDVSCEQLPPSFTRRLGSCEIDGEEAASAVVDNSELWGSQADQFPLGGGQAENSSSQSAANNAREREQQDRAAEKERRLECRDRYDSQIDGIDAQLRSGYSIRQGETLKSRRRDLEEKKRDC